MFSTVLGLFSQDLAVDLGTDRTRLWLRHAGIVTDVPTVVAVHEDRHGHRQVVSVGAGAAAMRGRTPEDMNAIEPVKAGRIDEFEVAEALLLHLLREIHGRNGWIRPRMVVAVPVAASEMEVRAIRDSCEGAGAREVLLVPRPLAAALGAGLPIHEPSGQMIVDVGAGSTEISLLSLQGVVSSVTVPGGGRGIDRAIASWVRTHRALEIGECTSREAKESLGTAADPDPGRREIVKGRCLRRGVPSSASIDAVDVHAALQPSIEQLVQGVRKALEDAPPELASDVIDHGLVLTGGGARLRRLDQALRERTGLPVVMADDPEGATIRGAGQVLEQLDLREAIAC